MGYIFCHINIDPHKLQERAEENHVNITGLIRTCVVQIHSTSLWVGGRTFQVSCNLEYLVLVKLLHTILHFGFTTAWGLKSSGMWWSVPRWKVPDFFGEPLCLHYLGSEYFSWTGHSKNSSWIASAWGWRHYDPSKYLQLLTQQHSTASHPTTPEFLRHRCKNLKPWTVHSVHSAVLYHNTLAIKITVFCDGGSRFL